MSARLQDDRPQLGPMSVEHLDAVMAVETAAYAFPWTRGNFIDSLAAGYPARVLEHPQGELLGYFVAMGGVDEMHLLNITVAPAVQGRGHARVLFDELIALCRSDRARELWLEVRASNAHARALYTHLGLREVGRRKGYYPAPLGRREDAIVMSLKLAPNPPSEGPRGVE
ncbi:MAG: ribosomal protein S18-alanine N-acetyltransferase [Pseudomonadota bacterium]|nr:ribosomal protein S18-alanine N-acetyltransferase [Pseudomonadota bacterium]